MTRGRHPVYETAEEMQKNIEKYFEECKGEIYKDDEGRPVLDKWGNLVIIGAKPPTVTGLALALGFNSRTSLLNYEAKDGEFLDTITRAKARVEAYTESRLFDKDGANGAKFSLSNNFRGWAEKKELTGADGGPLQMQVSRIAGMTETELDAARKLLAADDDDSLDVLPEITD